MLELLASSLDKSLIERLRRAFFGPPVLYWLGVFVTMAWFCPGFLTGLGHRFAARALLFLGGLSPGGNPPLSEPQVLLAAAFVLLFVSAWLSELVRGWIYRLLEGYLWPLRIFHWGAGNWRRGKAAWEKRLEQLWEQRLEQLRKRLWEQQGTDLSLEQEWGQLDARVRRLPPDEAIMPTAFGNVLSAAENYVRRRYGLDPVVVWPHIWFLLSDERREIESQRRALDAAVDGVFFSLLFLPWGFFCPLAFVAGLVAAWLAYRLAVERAALFGELVRAVFDLHRLRLYDSLGCPRPAPDKEWEKGRRFTQLLWRGLPGC